MRSEVRKKLKIWTVAANYLTPVALCLIISLGFVKMYTSSGLTQSLPRTASWNLFEQLVWILAPAVLGFLGVTGLYWLISKHKDFELRVLFSIVVAPTSAILVIVVSQTLLTVIAKTYSSFMVTLTVLISLYVAVFSVVFILSNAFSTTVRNFIFILYGALLGSFMSLLLPTVSLVLLLVSIALYDLVMFNSKWIVSIVRDLSLSRGVGSKFGYIGQNVEIGIGELIFYSFVPAHVEAYYDFPLLVLTLLMTAAGVMLNMLILSKKGFLAGLPAPILLGLIPLVVSLAM